MRRTGSRSGTPAKRRGAGAAGIATVALAALLPWGCAGERGSEETSTRDRPPGRSSAAVTPARYRTDLAAVPFATPASAVYLSFHQEVTGATVHRRYTGWRLDGARRSRILAIDDSLAAPRAAWRILPGPDLRVVAGDGEEPVSLVLASDGTAWEVSVDSTLASWPGPTGQRERMALGRVITDATRPALIVVRRSARPLDAPPTRARSRLFVLVDPDGRGFVVQTRRSEPPPGATSEEDEVRQELEATVRIHRGDAARLLDDVRLVPVDTATSPTAWELRGPGGATIGRLELDPGRLADVRPGDEPAEGGAPEGGDAATEEADPATEGTERADGTATVSVDPVRGSLEALGDGTLRGLRVVVRGR